MARQWNSTCRQNRNGVRNHEMQTKEDGSGYSIPACKYCGACFVNVRELSPKL